MVRDTPTQYGNELVAFDGNVYFAADDNIHGNELWRTDGTQTTMVADLNPGVASNNGDPHRFTVVGDRLFFNARPDSVGASSETVFYIDAAASTTVKKAKAAPTNGGSAVTAVGPVFASVNGKALISRYTEAIAHYAVYALGSSGDTFQDLQPGDVGSIDATNVFTPAATAGGWTYYARSNTNTSPGVGLELWRTNGSSVELAADIYPNDPVHDSYPGSNPGSFYATSDRVYFVADDGTHGRELWVTNPADKTDTHIVHEHHANATGTSIEDPGAVANGSVLYYTPDDPVTGGEVWRTDGTEAGTRVVKDITPGTGGFSAPDPFAFKSGVGMLRGTTIYYADGTPDTATAIAETDGDGIGPTQPVVRGDRAYFVAGYSTFGQALWRTDGTAAGTNAITAGGFDDSANGCTCAQSLAVLGDKVILFSRAPGTPAAGDEKLLYLDTTQADDTRQATTPTTVTGTAAVGQTLTANLGTWTGKANKYEYAWLRDGVEIGTPLGIFQTTYTVSDADRGKQIQARIIAKGIGAPNAVSSNSAPVMVGGAVATVTPGPAATPRPGATPSPTPALTVRTKAKLKGNAKVGKKLKLKLPSLAQSGVKLSFRWFANGKRIKKQKKSSLKLTRKLKGKKITVKITAKKAGYKTLTLKVGPTGKVR